MTHHEWAKGHPQARPCTCHDLNYGGECFNCGYPGEDHEKLINHFRYLSMDCPLNDIDTKTRCPKCEAIALVLKNLGREAK